MNNKGQIIITDILLYLILLLVIFSLVIYATETLNDNQVTKINNKQANQFLKDSLSTLTKTSGTPSNWEYSSSNNIQTIGLKSNKGQLLSYDKLIKLKTNPNLLDGYFPDSLDYSLTLYPRDNVNSKELIAGKTLLLIINKFSQKVYWCCLIMNLIHYPSIRKIQVNLVHINMITNGFAKQ